MKRSRFRICYCFQTMLGVKTNNDERMRTKTEQGRSSSVSQWAGNRSAAPNLDRPALRVKTNIIIFTDERSLFAPCEASARNHSVVMVEQVEFLQDDRVVWATYTGTADNATCKTPLERRGVFTADRHRTLSNPRAKHPQAFSFYSLSTWPLLATVICSLGSWEAICELDLIPLLPRNWRDSLGLSGSSRSL